jgi:uncharacterized protein YecE (DUF72 family)
MRATSAAPRSGKVVIGCAGFPVPPTRYFKDFAFVEIQETHVGVPGMGTLRRWRREAPEDFCFAMLGPREIGQEGFRAGKVVDAALKNLADVGKELEAKIVVFVSPADLAASRANKTAVKEFLLAVRKQFDRVIWEAPLTWNAGDAEAIAESAKAIAARDPLVSGLSQKPVAYYRLPGPAGHKSRYEDPAIDKLAELAREAKHDEVTYVFANVDMFADAKRFRKAAKLG